MLFCIIQGRDTFSFVHFGGQGGEGLGSMKTGQEFIEDKEDIQEHDKGVDNTSKKKGGKGAIFSLAFSTHF